MPNNNVLDFNSVDSFVEKQKRRGIDVSWEGWDLVFWRENPDGFLNKNGVFNKKTGKWGIASRVTVNSSGNWRVPNKYVRAS